MPTKRNNSSTSENEEEKKKAPKIIPQTPSPARTATNNSTTAPPATPVLFATNTPNTATIPLANNPYTSPRPAGAAAYAPSATPVPFATNTQNTTTIPLANNPYTSSRPAGAAAYSPTTPPRTTSVANSNSTTHPTGTAANAPTTPLRGTTSGTFHLSPAQMAVVDARKNRDTALQEQQKAMVYSKSCFKKLRAAKLSYQNSMKRENYLKEKIKGYDLNIHVMEQIDTSMHASKNGGTQKFTIDLSTPIKSIKEEEFSDGDDDEMLQHVVTGVGGKPVDGGNAKAGMKTTGEEPADYDDIDGGKSAAKEGEGVNTTDEKAAVGGNANTGMKTTGEEPSGKKGGDANVSKK